MKNLRLYGRIREEESNNGIPGLSIEVKDTNLFIDEVIAVTKSRRDGLFEIDFPHPCPEQPDIYLNIKKPDGRLISSANCNVNPDLEIVKEVNINVSRKNQIAASDINLENKLISWTFLPDNSVSCQWMQEIQKDMVGKTSILQLLKEYMNELYLKPDNNSDPFFKLMTVFQSGIIPEVIEGHYYGVWMFFRTDDQEDYFPPINKIMQVLLGARLDIRGPWVGKTFIPLSRSQTDSISESKMSPDFQAFRGINHFQQINLQIPVNIAFQLLNIWKTMNDSTIKEEKKFGYQKNGGYIISAKGPSLCPKTSREVFILNYRWEKLANKPPFCWLIDEFVQIADGLYLGQILIATKHLFDSYDPAIPPEDYAYQTYGYFLIFSEMWNKEARRLFPSLDMPSLR